MDESNSNANLETIKNNSEEDTSNLVPYVDFNCAICGLNEKGFFGNLKASDGFYPSPVFYMKDPFIPPARVKARRPVLADYLIMGAACGMCEQSVCINKACSIYFGGHFCATCLVRERRRFPAQVLTKLQKAQENLSVEPK
ncbi:unnamed protein product [Auanema sp. JU1783]|nr:unnamed protein product [Auanema sp. JU1783]